MSRATILAAGRRAAEAGMIDTCRIERVWAQDTNIVTAAVTESYRVVYEGACRIQATAAAAGTATVGEAALHIAGAELQLPVVGTEGIAADDRVTVLTCLNDAEMVGRMYTVTGVAHKSHATSRRLPLQEILG